MNKSATEGRKFSGNFIRKSVWVSILSNIKGGFNWLFVGQLVRNKRRLTRPINEIVGKICYWYNFRIRLIYDQFIGVLTEGLSAYRIGRRLTHEAIFEVIWTIVPTLVLVLLAIPSLKLLYSLDYVLYDYEPIVTVKVVGHQWFWSYEYLIFGQNGSESIEFDSYMVSEEDLGPGGLRLLEVDNPLVIPAHSYIRFLITAVDVLHSWAVPSLGIKVDAVPGRLNQVFTFIKRPGEFYGQCSEICGVNHGFMPIRLIVT